MDHTKLKAEWERLGKPAMEVMVGAGWLPATAPVFSVEHPYRFKGDPHWELRQKWLDSNKMLPIESEFAGLWDRCDPLWKPDCKYREAQPQPTQTDLFETFASHPLQQAFDQAIAQATGGKGERHGGDTIPFFDQQWYANARHTGPGGLMFQAIKKAKESCQKPNQALFEKELLGAMVYLGMAYLYVQKHPMSGPIYDNTSSSSTKDTTGEN